MDEKHYYVYIVASKSRVIYTGITNGLRKRVWQHKSGEMEGFTKQFRCSRLVYFETFHDVRNAIAREKQIKAFRREKNVALIEAENPTWEDLAGNWYENGPLVGLTSSLGVTIRRES
jgi:putative endonuclease